MREPDDYQVTCEDCRAVLAVGLRESDDVHSVEYAGKYEDSAGDARHRACGGLLYVAEVFHARGPQFRGDGE